MKLLTVLAAATCGLLATLLVGCDGLGTTWGKVHDHPLFRADIIADPKPFQVVTQNYTGPPKGRLRTISGINVVNWQPEMGGTVKLLSGGPGERTATIQFISERGKGLDFGVFIHGY